MQRRGLSPRAPRCTGLSVEETVDIMRLHFSITSRAFVVNPHTRALLPLPSPLPSAALAPHTPFTLTSGLKQSNVLLTSPSLAAADLSDLCARRALAVEHGLRRRLQLRHPRIVLGHLIPDQIARRAAHARRVAAALAL